MTIKQEVLRFVRNSDVFTTTERSVITANLSETLSSDTEHVINKTNIKNIRNLYVDGVLLRYGFDYTYDLDYLDTTIKCKITFTTAQTGELTGSYDYGTDKIFPDYPREDLKLTSYPRMAVDRISRIGDAFGVGGNQFIHESLFTIIIYSQSQDEIEEKLEFLEDYFQSNAKTFYHSPFIKPVSIGPIIKSESRNQTVLNCNLDVLAIIEVK